MPKTTISVGKTEHCCLQLKAGYKHTALKLYARTGRDIETETQNCLTTKHAVLFTNAAREML